MDVTRISLYLGDAPADALFLVAKRASESATRSGVDAVVNLGRHGRTRALACLTPGASGVETSGLKAAGARLRSGDCWRQNPWALSLARQQRRARRQVPQDVERGIDTVSVWQGERKRGNGMVRFNEKELARERKTGMSSSLLTLEPIYCQVFLQIEGTGSQKNRFLAKKVFYGGCMTGRSPPPSEFDSQE